MRNPHRWFAPALVALVAIIYMAKAAKPAGSVVHDLAAESEIEATTDSRKLFTLAANIPVESDDAVGDRRVLYWGQKHSPTSKPTAKPTPEPTASPTQSLTKLFTSGSYNADLCNCNNATIRVRCDNKLQFRQYELTDDAYVEEPSDRTGDWDLENWQETFTTVVDLSGKTHLEFECKDISDVGGFVAEIEACGYRFITDESVTLESDPSPYEWFINPDKSDSSSSTLVYTAMGAGKWGSTGSGLKDEDTFWVWNDNNLNTMTFGFNLECPSEECTSATIEARCDNYLQFRQYELSDDSLFVELASDRTGEWDITEWENTFTKTINLTDNTHLEFECKDVGSVGGFQAVIDACGTRYVTNGSTVMNADPDSLEWYIEPTLTDASSKDLVYTQNGNGVWGLPAEGLTDTDVYWVWNGETYNTMTFAFNFGRARYFTNAPTTPSPTNAPTNAPTTPSPTDAPTNAPTTPSPTDAPTNAPTTPSPTDAPTNAPTTPSPTNAPTNAPTTPSPTDAPTNAPTTPSPTDAPTNAPTTPSPTDAPTNAPTTPSPTDAPTNAPTTPSPTDAPTNAPTTPSPTDAPTNAPTTPSPTDAPTNAPTTPSPTDAPTNAPTTPSPTDAPTEVRVSETDTNSPTSAPTLARCDITQAQLSGGETLSTEKAVESIDACRELCIGVDQCTGYSWNSKSKVCLLKSGTFKLKKNKKSIAGTFVCPSPSSCYSQFYMYNGASLLRTGNIASVEECAEICYSTSSCVAWVYQASKEICSLRKSAGKKKSTTADFITGLTAGCTPTASPTSSPTEDSSSTSDDGTIAPTAAPTLNSYGFSVIPCGPKVNDVLFILDSSGSVSSTEWAQLTEFIQALGSAFQVGSTSSDSRLAAVRFASSVTTLWDFDSTIATSQSLFQTTMDTVPRVSSGTGTGGALIRAQKIFANTEIRSGLDRRVAIILTDGNPTKNTDCKANGYPKNPKTCAKKAAADLRKGADGILGTDDDVYLVFVRIGNGVKAAAFGSVEDLQVQADADGLMSISDEIISDVCDIDSSS